MKADSELPTVVVDSDVVSYLFKRDTRAEAYEELLIGRRMLLSFMSLAELLLWAEIAGWGQRRRQHFGEHLDTFIIQFADRELCEEWKAVTAAARAAGRPIQSSDAWIAATARLFDVPLVANNPGDYLGVPDLTVLTASAQKTSPRGQSQG